MNRIKTVSFYQDTINRKSFDIQRVKNLNKKESNLKKFKSYKIKMKVIYLKISLIIKIKAINL